MLYQPLPVYPLKLEMCWYSGTTVLMITSDYYIASKLSRELLITVNHVYLRVLYFAFWELNNLKKHDFLSN
jgi:hypothetical protein